MSRSPSRRVEYLDARRPSSIEALSYRSERFLSVPSAPTGLVRSNSSRGANDRDGSRRGSEASTRRMSSTSLISRYRYLPLDTKVRRAIRVIRIRPHLQDGMISCDIEHVTTKSSYRAVSYTWGKPDDPHEPILISGCPFTVRRNLHRFLSHARKDYSERALWIDALCINQDDKQERARQVEIMSKIYSNTKEVLVWLGPRLDYAGHAIRRMQAYERMSDTDMALSSSKDNDFWKGFKAINSARYWDRVWCVQEFVQPPNGKIILGDDCISFETFQSTIRRFNSRIYRLVLQYWVFGPRRNDDFHSYISNIHPLWKQRMEPSVDADWAILSGQRFCKDIRDRIYGIMPLATHGNTLRVDYHLNPFEVLLESIWLEHDSHMDRTEVLMNLANILLLTPASICMYAEKRKSGADWYLRKMSHDRDAEKIHLKAGASKGKEEEWLREAADGRAVVWHNFARDHKLKMPERILGFPSKEQCPWNMVVYTSTSKSTFGLKIAIDSRSVLDDKGRVGKLRDIMSKKDFLTQKSRGAIALGVYETSCAPCPLIIYYALIEGLEEIGRGGGNNAFFGLDGVGLDDLDFDLDI